MRRNLVVVFGLSFLSACNLPFSPDRAVVLRIVEIRAPATAASSSAFSVTFVVESGGCKSFERMEVMKSAGEAVVVAHGRDTSGPEVSCPNDIRHEPQEVTMRPPNTDPFVIRAAQPDGSQITAEVRIQ